ncbi:HlyD family efflux transporter periplasmic adaptor subunit [Myxacorys almedinensis]|uniref:HlyD family efflux transporter periplasmic adaptor subunit n=1 Tax=Myxacorys almedinensis A TaxID=2690445 RepID=A0A8J7Z3F6_9CYAN|nr:HlyD family efflux transporter periplasmic adaptor subunit [Myxacorys almedinensis]NDJ19289.1 HlyD family efflux transporter periplasmic adaptor subunit [Myxacorys almedinensis A]
MLNPVPQKRRTPVFEPHPLPPPEQLKPSEQGVGISPSQWSDSLQTMLDQPPSTLPIRFTLGGIVFCTCFAAWAWFGQINEVAHAQGKLEPKGQAYKVQSSELGKIQHVFVKEGQAIKAGQAIAELDNDVALYDIERLERELASAQTELQQMQFMLGQNRLQANLRTLMAQEKTAMHQGDIKQARSEAMTSQALIDQLQTDVSAQTERLERLQPLVQEGAIAQEYIFSAEQSLRDRQRTITEHQGSLQKNTAIVERLQSELTQKQAEVKEVQLESQQQFQQLEIQITQQHAKIDGLMTQIKTAQTKLKQRFVYAPVSGVVSTLNVKHPGEVLQTGQALAEIAPSHQPLTLSAVLPNQEAGFVKPGMTVQLKFDAFPYQDYGMVPGKVTKISQDTHLDEQRGQVYRLEIQVDQAALSPEHTADATTRDRQKIALKAGQTATAEIITRNRRIVDVLLDPLKQLQGGMNL